MARAAESPKAGTLSVVLENDMFYDIDRHYTNGLMLVWVPDGDASTPEWVTMLARLMPWFPEPGGIRHGYAFGQSMFTPSDTKIADPSLRDRPYAGWLYGTIGLGVESGRQLDQFGMTFGVVGPASLAGQTQKFAHKVLSANEPQGWDTQLGNEPGIVATYQRSWRRGATSSLFGTRLDFTPHLGAALGNVFTYCNAGVTMRYGRRLPGDFGPPRIQPGLPVSGELSPVSGFGWHLFAGIEGRAVAHNIFLDGNTFRDSRSVDKKHLVGDLLFGVVLDWSDLRLGYTHVLRTREFQTQESKDNFGSFSLSFGF
ncbi:MAG: lipid A deacylase LpxR family protein [Deltaproteobacteria bacterium]|nr:lipid A deacylase LpxR family protein [Deltaproteobacteria bacterium]